VAERNLGDKGYLFLTKKPRKLKTREGAIVEITVPELGMPFVRGADEHEVLPLEQTDDAPGAPALMEYDKSLFSLGTVLIELWYPIPIQDLRTHHSQCQPEDADYQTAQQHIGELVRDAGPNYGFAVSYCSNGGKFGARSANVSKYVFDDVSFKNAVQENVVCLLQKNLEVSWSCVVRAALPCKLILDMALGVFNRIQRGLALWKLSGLVLASGGSS
jgi:hypothetical protein